MWAWKNGEDEANVSHPEKSAIQLAKAAIKVRLGRRPEANRIFDLQLRALCKIKDNSETAVAFELNRLGNIYYGHYLYQEAGWLYGKAAEAYSRACGEGHQFTRQAREYQKKALHNAELECPK